MRLIFFVSFHFDIFFSSPSPAAASATAAAIEVAGNAETAATFLGAETALLGSPSSTNLKSVYTEAQIQTKSTNKV